MFRVTIVYLFFNNTIVYMPRRKTKRNFKKRGGVGSSSKKRRPSPSLGTRGHIRKKSRTSRQTYAVTAEGQEVDEGSARANEQEA